MEKNWTVEHMDDGGCWNILHSDAGVMWHSKFRDAMSLYNEAKENICFSECRLRLVENTVKVLRIRPAL